MGLQAYADATLDAILAQRSLSELVHRAKILGEPSRGALIFHQPGLSCTQCHSIEDVDHGAEKKKNLLGPDLLQLGERANYEHVITSILKPSQDVREGYQAMKFLLGSGKILTGMLRSETEKQLIVMIPGNRTTISIPPAEVEQRIPTVSMMPAGLVNQLSNESEFYDLASFIVELGKAGPKGASRFKPPAELNAPQPLPSYEKELDHAGLISAWDRQSFKRGKELYNSLCINCHGTRQHPGSLPNALRFATGKFRNGADPLSMYKTITHGFGMMLPQRQLVPEQKYDVIHYIREAYLKPHNQTQFTVVDDDYLSSLPKGTKRGPAPLKHQPWKEMDYGPFLINTYEMAGPDTLPRPEITSSDLQQAARANHPPEESWPANTNFAYKGIAIRLDDGPGGVAAGSHWITFDHDTMRIAGAWSGEGFIDWEGILLNGRHEIAPRTIGKQHFANPPGPGWAHPVTGSFHDPRLRARDGRAYGPLPHDWAHYKGLYKHGNRVVVSYTVGRVPILESYRMEYRTDPTTKRTTDVWVRVLNVGKSSHDLTMRVTPENSAFVVVDCSEVLSLAEEEGYIVAHIPAEQTPVNFELLISENEISRVNADDRIAKPENLQQFTQGGPARWQPPLQTIPQIGNNDGPFAIDTLTRPIANPWKSRLRFSGLDFLDNPNRLVVCCCDGDVWVVEGIDQIGQAIRWRRIASGLFQPLGVKVIDGKIFVGCRDQIVILNDLNGDGETDYYENFNNDHQVTAHFHEFAMGLQSDASGNLYYAKSARHARDSLVPQHGTLLRVSADGTETKILANGFRAANGVCLNPDGSMFVTDQEGHWTPMNRINRVIKGGFYGNMYSYGAPEDASDAAMQQPLCWVDRQMDRSPAELLWIPPNRWGPLGGSLLSLSYGNGKIFVVPNQRVNGQWQGGICQLPLPEFPTGIMRARFHPDNGQMYVCGMNAWGSGQTTETGGLFRVRYTGKPIHVPIGLSAHKSGMRITFSEPLNAVSASNPDNYLVETWSLKRTNQYGSDRYDEKSLTVVSALVSNDGKSIVLEIPDFTPTMCLQIAYQLKDTSEEAFTGIIQSTVHYLQDD